MPTSSFRFFPRFPPRFCPRTAAWLGLAALLGAGCGKGGEPQKTSSESWADEEAKALRVLDPRPATGNGDNLDRFELVALADRLAASAASAKAPTSATPSSSAASPSPAPSSSSARGAGAPIGVEPVSARRLRLAAELRVFLYRTRHQEVDGREALVLLDTVLPQLPEPLACEAAKTRALLAGELAGDPQEAAAELRAAAATRPGCGSVLAPALAVLPSAPPSGRGAGGGQAAVIAPPGRAESGIAEAAVASPDNVPDTGAPVEVRGVEVFGAPEGARVVVRLSGPARFQFGDAGPAQGKTGARVYVDLARAKLPKQKKKKLGSGIVERVRLGERDGGVRVVLDLERPVFRRVFYLPEPFRVVIDVTTRAPGEESKATGHGVRDVRRVVLDPGHGGHDPGAIGPTGLREKDVTLDIAHRVGPVLARELGITTLLTRDDDAYIALEERTARANAFGADLFVSIHCNASESANAHGVQTFVLDTTSDHVAAKVAARENAASAEAGDVVRRLSGDLKLAELGSRSTRLADLLQRAAVASLDRYPNVADQGVKTAGFFVLVGAQMPSALFETSFISNGTEEERLRSEEYRQRLADAIVNAVRAYREGK
jgi:N-acetylmuramoyl-L-alanine amidase